MPSMPPGRRAQTGGNFQHTKRGAVWCWLCNPGARTLIGHYPNPAAASTDHIERVHPAKEPT